MLLLLIVLSSPLVASPGETAGQLDQRFGTSERTRPSGKGRVELRFYKVKGSPVEATLIDGKCVRESFEINKDSEAAAILETMSRKQPWRRTTLDFQDGRWEYQNLRAYTSILFRRATPGVTGLLLTVEVVGTDKALAEADPPPFPGLQPFDFGNYRVR